jgi:endonuclease YncB( thermonuclease family)
MFNILRFFVRFIGFFFGFRWHEVRLKNLWHGDGDSFWVVTEKGKQLHLRLKGIDCPEYSQAFGEEAGDRRKKLCGSQSLRVRTSGRDAYKRHLASVKLPDGTNLAMALLREGLAYNEGLSWLAERSAKKRKIGIWSQKRRERVIPRDFRRFA